MDYNFKRIADVEEIESVSEDTMFLVNDGGVIKQTHAQMQSDGDGSSLNPIFSNAKATGGIGWTEQGGWTTLVSETVTTTIDTNIAPFAIGEFETSGWEIKDGATYKVTFNGTEYGWRSGGTIDSGDTTLTYIGDFDERTGVPSFYALPFGILSHKLATEASGTYDVVIQEEFGETVHKIDSKYIDKMIVTVEYSEDDDGYIADKTFEEIKSAINSGMDIKCVLKDYDEKVLLNLSYYSFDRGLK